MKPHSKTLTVALAAALATFGCGDGGDVDPDDLAEPEPAAPETAVEGEAATMDPDAAVLQVRSLDGRAYLTDGRGIALYLLESDPAGSSTCEDACAGEWPPFLARAGEPRVEGAGLQPDLVATIERTDGTRQVTYGGHALYHYHDDTAPGDTQGQDVHDEWGEWYLVTPAGEALEPESERGG